MNKEQLVDLDKNQLAILDKIIKRHIPNKTVWAYGSRVTWKASEISDLDLVVFDCGSAEIADLKEDLEESNLLISVDVMDWENIPDNFKKNIRKKYVVLQEKLNLEGWQEMRLKDAAKINPLESMPKGTKAKKVNMDALIPFTRKISGYVDGIYKGGSKFRNGDTLLARITPCLENGKTVFVDFLEANEIGFGSTEFIVIREKANITNKDFLYYFAISKDFRETAIKSMTGTSGRQRVELDEILKYKFIIPPLPEQKAIAEVLSSFDDKIDLLHRQNKTLEDMAQTIFRQWFVEKADKMWEENPLGETVDISIGRTPPRKEFHWFSKNKRDWKWISIKDMATSEIYFFNTSEYLTQYAVEKFNIPIIPKNTVILSFKMTVGRVGITTEDMLSNEAIAQFKINSDTPFTKEYLYFYLKTFRFESLGSTSSIVTSINTAMIKSIMIAIPDSILIERFENICKSVFKKIYSNQSQVHTLENLRDTLLPKLMSGEVKIEVLK
ncbi:restriction endonuclease subunit S [Candidatus Spongiihabitans sp.]|uniref:restriction endonuclease subunit S n=1 Tax=Candidatus Spongiihabitans sp. TaxID=3101308 RepID=UPI003C7ACDB0